MANASNLYAVDGRCHNSEPGSFGHECGATAYWLGTDASGFTAGFCDACKEGGYECQGIVTWEPIARKIREVGTVGRLHRTRFKELAFRRYGRDWRFVSILDHEDCVVGRIYHSKSELLGDLTQYARENWGLE
jgi:hypothetical protein